MRQRLTACLELHRIFAAAGSQFIAAAVASEWKAPIAAASAARFPMSSRHDRFSLDRPFSFDDIHPRLVAQVCLQSAWPWHSIALAKAVSGLAPEEHEQPAWPSLQAAVPTQAPDLATSWAQHYGIMQFSHEATADERTAGRHAWTSRHACRQGDRISSRYPCKQGFLVYPAPGGLLVGALAAALQARKSVLLLRASSPTSVKLRPAKPSRAASDCLVHSLDSASCFQLFVARPVLPSAVRALH